MIWQTKYLLFLLLFFSFGEVGILSAQDGRNPFELKHRLGKENNQKVETTAPVSSKEEKNPFEVSHRSNTEEPAIIREEKEEEMPSTVATPSIPATGDNPFELKHRTKATLEPAKEGNPFELKKEIRPVAKAPTEEVKAPVSKQILSESTYTFWIIIGMLILYTLSFSMYKSFVVKTYRAFTNENFLKLVHREQGGILQFPYFFLYLVFIINTGIFIYFICRYFGYIPVDRLGTLFALIAIVGGVFLLKHLALRFMGFIFPIGKETQQYSFTITIFSIIVGLVLAPLNTFIAYAPGSITTQLVFGSAFIIALIYLFRHFRGLFIGSRYIAMHKFHFFMYLCTVEIAPVFILLKTIMLYAGIQ